MRFGLRSESVADVNKVGAILITSRRVIFTPNSDIKKELAETSVSITCYNRKGEIVKRVTSTDDADIEDPENDNPDGPSTGSGTGNGGTQSGGTNTNRQYTLSVSSANTAQGTVTGGGTYSEGSRVNVTATPKSGYQFDKWSDGNASSTRTIQVSKNESFVAQFKAAEQTGGDGTSTGDEDDEHL